MSNPYLQICSPMAVLQIPVRRPEHLETTSLGAAFAAGIATGFWTKEWVLGSTSEEKRHGDYTDFLPKVCTKCYKSAD